MVSKNIITEGRNLGIAGGIFSIISVFLPWYFASASAGMLGSSSISVNGLGWKNGEGLLMGLVSGTVNWEFQGMGVLALGIASIGSFSGELMGATMYSGVGYGLYVVLLGGAAAAAGGLLSWRDIND